MAAPPPQSPDVERRLHLAIHGLSERAPMLSAARTFLPRQTIAIVSTLAVVVGLAVLWPWITLPALVGLTIVIYLSTILFRVSLLYHAVRHPSIEIISDAEARATPDWVLPVYTVLIPCYREAEVLAQILVGLEQIEYPRDRLDIKLLLEEDDVETIQAARSLRADRLCELVVVPAADPRTKPKALNYGLQSARGLYVTIFDAEDRPDPLQLRKAAIALQRAPSDIACLQAELAYWNADQNIITRWFTLEYELWFRQFLPGLSRMEAPLPLGGTSNHFSREVLVRAGAWDPYNVTEDADLGVRLHRLGYRTGMLGSITYEEANSDFVNWVKQRSRWYKGYLQTWLVHMRQPVQLLREVGLRGFLRFNLFVGGTPTLALLNPVFWALTILWFLLKPAFILELLPAPVYYSSLLAWLLGNFFFLYTFVVAAHHHPERRVFTAALLAPLYWVAMSLAAAKAFLQLVFTPQYWEKTQHGLAKGAEAAPETGGAA